MTETTKDENILIPKSILKELILRLEKIQRLLSGRDKEDDTN